MGKIDTAAGKAFVIGRSFNSKESDSFKNCAHTQVSANDGTITMLVNGKAIAKRSSGARVAMMTLSGDTSRTVRNRLNGMIAESGVAAPEGKTVGYTRHDGRSYFTDQMGEYYAIDPNGSQIIAV